MDIQSSDNILLLGAGFTKNYGGLLSSEMWAEIFNHEKIQAQPRIKTLMLNNFDYEAVYYYVLEGFEDQDGKYIEFTDDEKESMIAATKSAYGLIDKIIIDYAESRLYRGSKPIDEFLYYFDGTHSRSITNNVFIFTLNQDLFFERIHENYDKKVKTTLLIPGIDNDPNWFPFYDKPFDYYKLPTEDVLRSIKGRFLERNNYFLIKLHGSCNWVSSDGSSTMVIGRGKKEQIQKEPLLKYYHEIFETILSQDLRRLFIIGYGFGDEHINSVISKAVKDNGLKIYLLYPESPEEFKRRLLERSEKSENLIDIWNGVSGYYQFVKEVLVSGINENRAKAKNFYNILLGVDDPRW